MVVLSERQTELVGLLAEGHTIFTAAHELGMSPNTARSQLARARERNEQPTTMALVMAWKEEQRP